MYNDMIYTLHGHKLRFLNQSELQRKFYHEAAPLISNLGRKNKNWGAIPKWAKKTKILSLMTTQN